MANQPPPPQTNFPLLQQSLTTAATELDNLQNPPQINQGDWLVTAIKQMQASLGNLTGQVNKLHGRFDKLQGTVDDIQGRVNNLEGAVHVIQGRVNNLEGAVDVIQGGVNNLEGAVDVIQGGVNNLEGAVDVIQGAVNNLQVTSNQTQMRLLTLDTNNLARVQNSKIAVTSRVALQPLVNVDTNMPINLFPTTGHILDNLQNGQVDAILQELGVQAPAAPTLAAKKRLLRQKVGLNPDPN